MKEHLLCDLNKNRRLGFCTVLYMRKFKRKLQNFTFSYSAFIIFIQNMNVLNTNMYSFILYMEQVNIHLRKVALNYFVSHN